jgi:hypothetical protein
VKVAQRVAFVGEVLEISLAISEGTINEPPKVARRKDKRPKKSECLLFHLASGPN